MNKLITAESVSYGHPDKVADQISDAILDGYLKEDPNSKVAVETLVKDNMVVIGGEVKSSGTIDHDTIIRDVVKDIGYTDAEHGFYYKNITIINLIGKQSPEINGAIEKDSEEIGAGDQGFMTGYATNETETYMPLAMYVSKKLVDYVTSNPILGPDVKTQTTIELNDDGSKRIHTILISTMHPSTKTVDEIRDILTDSILDNLIGLNPNTFALIDKDTKIVINPAGSWNVGGPVSDCGVTGRKIVVDQYGPYCPVGGGAFSGKDSSKVDRSAAYLARYIAKNVVAAGLAKECKVEIAYMIGIAEPASLSVDTFGGTDDKKLADVVRTIFPMTPTQIINHFDLTKPIFNDTAKNGHFGNTHLPWEKLDKVADLKDVRLETFTVKS